MQQISKGYPIETHSITNESPLNHHSVTIQSPFSHHEFTMKHSLILRQLGQEHEAWPQLFPPAWGPGASINWSISIFPQIYKLPSGKLT